MFQIAEHWNAGLNLFYKDSDTPSRSRYMSTTEHREKRQRESEKHSLPVPANFFLLIYNYYLSLLLAWRSMPCHVHSQSASTLFPIFTARNPVFIVIEAICPRLVYELLLHVLSEEQNYTSDVGSGDD